MKRRDFVSKFGVGALVGGGLLACGEQEQKMSTVSTKNQVRHWKMVTTWPKNFPVIGTGAEYFAKLITEISGGRLQVKVYAAGELIPAFECFDAVSQGAVQMGHGAAYYWRGKNPAFQFFSSIPFGMNTTQMNAWLYAGGGLTLWEESYRPFGVIPFPAGNTGMQMAGWFNREINSIADLRGLKMRIPGLGGEVLNRAGATTVTLPGGELLTAMQTGVIDAAEWVNPYSDVVFGLHKVAKFYYYPGWHEPATALECIVNEKAWNDLPADLQQIIKIAANIVNHKMTEEYTAYNGKAVQDILDAGEVQLRRLPDDVLAELQVFSRQVVQELAGSDEFAGKIYNSYMQFKESAKKWHNISESMYYQILNQKI